MKPDLDYLFDKECTCAFCGTSFTTKRVRRGAVPFVKRDADFCTYYKRLAANPILYTVAVCPTCGYAFTDQFSPVLSPAVRRRIETCIADKWTPKSYGGERGIPEAIATYKLGIYSAELKEELHSIKAGLYLRLAWLYRFLENAAEECRFLTLAASEYEQSYIHSDYEAGDKEMSEVRILYLIGELMRRIERYDQAVQYFSRAVQLKDQTIEQGIINMARDQWSLAREQYNEKRKLAGEPNTLAT